MNKAQHGRVLALDLRARRLGYSVQTDKRLLDFGSAVFHSPEQARQRVRLLIIAFRPSVLVLDSGAARGWRDHSRMTSVRKAIRREAFQHSVQVTTVSARMLRAFFAERGLRSKYDFATLAASWFPQLASRVPPKRKCYEREPLVMTSFDSVALGAVYLKQQQNFSG